MKSILLFGTYRRKSISSVSCDLALHACTKRADSVQLFVTSYFLLFYATYALLEKVNSFLNLGMTDYILLYININSALLFSHFFFFFLIIKILIKSYFIINFITNLRRKYFKIHFLTHFFHEQTSYTSYRLFLCTECHLF